MLEAVRVTDAWEVQSLCAQDRRQSGRTEEKSGAHFHVAMKLNKVKRWNPILTSRRPDKKLRRSRLSGIEVSEIAVGKDIKTCTELLALANEQKQEGKKDLIFFFKTGYRKLLQKQ